MVLVEAEEGAQNELGGERGWFGSWSSTRGGQHQGQAQQRQQRLKGIRNQSFDRLCQRSCLKEHPLLSAHLSVHPGRFDMREMVCTEGVEQQHQPATFIPKDLATPVVQSSHTIHTAPGDLCVHLCVCMVHTQPLGTLDLGQVLSGILRLVRGFQTLLIGGSLLALVLTTDHDLGQYGTEVCSKNTTGEHCALVLCCEADGRVRGGVEYLGPIIVPALGLPSTDRSVSINWDLAC